MVTTSKLRKHPIVVEAAYVILPIDAKVLRVRDTINLRESKLGKWQGTLKNSETQRNHDY